MISPYLELLHKENITSWRWWLSIPVVFVVWLFFYVPIRALLLTSEILKWLANKWESIIAAVASRTVLGAILMRFTETEHVRKK
ncbi:hypothetical protein OTK49_02820 [Vibrio coralliirubri]|uniref:hypothetical protein n=1 Tax=Vibrio coralliirubri TaxID=1516159 RepID=UPI002284CE56|nr:hypothetical protein [Vibrio coralliirubri]MCY9861451.1 hypothetical protein [Vibrio coralliirubri]